MLSAATTATAAVVRAPGDASASSAIWDEHAIGEPSFDGLGLVYDIIDVTGFATGGSEFDCDNCEAAFSGLHESYSPGGWNGGGIGGGSGLGGPWKKAKSDYAKPADVPTPHTTSNDSHPGSSKDSKSNGSGSVPEPTIAGGPPNLATNELPPADEAPQTFVVLPSCTDCLTTADKPTTTGATEDDGGNGDGGGSTDSSAAAIPEPGSMFLLGTGMLGLAVAVRRRLKR